MRARLAVLAALALVPAACSGDKQGAPQPQAPPEPEPAAEPEPEAEPEHADGYEASPSTKLADGSELYGGQLDAELPLTQLTDILDQPDQYADRNVKTQGLVQRVCKKMGCWMELAAGQGGPEVRAPMAGHSYFLPQSAVGKQAIVQARVEVRELSQADKEHFEAEGAKATDVGVSLHASAVAVR